MQNFLPVHSDLTLLTSLGLPLCMCSQYTSKSFNVQPYGECVESKGWSRWRTQAECQSNGGQWVMLHNYLEKATRECRNSWKPVKMVCDFVCVCVCVFIWMLRIVVDMEICFLVLPEFIWGWSLVWGRSQWHVCVCVRVCTHSFTLSLSLSLSLSPFFFLLEHILPFPGVSMRATNLTHIHWYNEPFSLHFSHEQLNVTIRVMKGLGRRKFFF